MKASTKFLKMYYKMPHIARAGLVWIPYGKKPMSLMDIKREVINKTELADKTLLNMGFVDD